MKNKFTILLVLCLIIIIAGGCGLGGVFGGDEKNSDDSSPPTESTTETSGKKKEASPSGEVIKIGITECDEVATFINDNAESIDDSYVTQAIVYTYKNYVLENIREGVENMSDSEKEKWAKSCKETMKQLKENIDK